ncbi:hypothetical protein CLV35_1625 [Motilibacter peucedani]|uniref:Uncharacterized protein n=1 Tax=Motilibacter peucedani TaxID=598650 RepID=A0A420XSP9_9ACTN|nr:hypothetical protein [Motilibacter peucedani]RKS77922.1 hypothetical protein CLV35_1625 [Motilibacter peucedani]
MSSQMDWWGVLGMLAIVCAMFVVPALSFVYDARRAKHDGAEPTVRPEVGD